MFDTATARRMMVDGQVRTADVTNLDLIAAMLAVPREQFVPPSLAGQAYLDSDIPLGAVGRCSSRWFSPSSFRVRRSSATDHVLDVGCGTGYSSAVLSHLVGSVVALEEDATLARRGPGGAVGRPWRGERDSGHRALDRRLAGGGAL